LHAAYCSSPFTLNLPKGLHGFLRCLLWLGRVAAMEEVALSKTSEIPRLVFVVITRPRRAFLQFLHHNHTPSPLAGFCSVRFHATVLRRFQIIITIEKIAACATFCWARGLFSFLFNAYSGLRVCKPLTAQLAANAPYLATFDTPPLQCID
jgi:hypothetical protein